MTASPSTTSVANHAGTKYLADIFMHVSSCDRELEKLLNRFDDMTRGAETRLMSQEQLRELADIFCDYRLEVTDLHAAVAPAAVRRAQEIAAAMPAYSQAIFDLKTEEVDTLVRPIFEEGGILEDFMPTEERFPAEMVPS